MEGTLQLAQRSRRTIPAQRNPLDKCTIVSIYPKAIHEEKGTISPGIFDIPAGRPNSPALLVVGSSSWWKETGPEEPFLEMPNSSIQVAKSIVDDYCNGLIAYNQQDAMPGLFYLHGNLTIEEIKKDYNSQLIMAGVKQNNWYRALITLADQMWAASNGNPLVIADDMRMACKELGQVKDWMENFTALDMVRCVACGALRNPQYPICGSCHTVVDRELAAKLNLGLTPDLEAKVAKSAIPVTK